MRNYPDSDREVAKIGPTEGGNEISAAPADEVELMTQTLAELGHSARAMAKEIAVGDATPALLNAQTSNSRAQVLLSSDIVKRNKDTLRTYKALGLGEKLDAVVGWIRTLPDDLQRDAIRRITEGRP